MQYIHVLYDYRCPLCQRLARWLTGQPAFIEVRPLAAGSEQARRLYPTLTDETELTVVSDEGLIYRGDRAWLMCLFALRDYRGWAQRLARPALLPFARQAFSLLSAHRRSLAALFRLKDEATLAAEFRRVSLPSCSWKPHETAAR